MSSSDSYLWVEEEHDTENPGCGCKIFMSGIVLLLTVIFLVFLW